MTVRDILYKGNPLPQKKKIMLEPWQILKTIAVLALATICSLVLDLLFGVGNESIIMIFLLGVLFSAVLTASSIYGIIASIQGLMLFNYFFTEPRFTFLIYSSSDIILLAFFMVTAIVSGFVTSRLQTQIRLTAENEKTARILYQIALGFLLVNGEENIVTLAVSYVKNNTGYDCEVCLDYVDSIRSTPDPDKKNIDYPIKSSEGQLGILRVFMPRKGVCSKDKMIIMAIATQLGIAIHRERLRAEQESIRLAMEREQQRNTLLRSIAHDLRSPLTALYGTSTLLADGYASLSESERHKLAANTSEETLWLINIVENILNMTRISEGQLVLNKGKEASDDLITNAVSHMKRFLKSRKFTMSLPDKVVLVPADGKLIVQVIVNLLENAIRHTPEDASISLAAYVKDGFLEIAVADTGKGIIEEMQSHIFDRFVMLDSGVTDSKQGLGLGLAICKAIIQAHGGEIWIENNKPHGARFVFTLPLEV